MKRGIILSLAALAFAVVLGFPRLAFAERAPVPNDSQSSIAEQLKDFKSSAHAIRIESDVLRSFGSNPRLSWQTHSFKHIALKEHINAMGQMLKQLEAQMSVASETQRMAIEQARPHLAAAAEDLTNAMNLAEENRRNVNFREYADSIQSLSAHADSLYELLDTVLDYEHAKTRMDNRT